ncbi:MAG: signal peptidase II [Oscillospiraceae bacterium]|nr:signal peptidase II [Oscillospiraceae bacterium]
MSVLIAAAIVAADWFVKRYAENALQGTDGVVLVPGVLKLIYTTNDGAAWSMLRGQQTQFIVMTVAVLLVAVYLLVRGTVRGWFGVVSLSACIGGAVGNFIDRVRSGYVVDMFKTLFVSFPVFNVADSFLTLGCIALGVYILFFHDREVLRERLPAEGGFLISAENRGGGVKCVRLGERPETAALSAGTAAAEKVLSAGEKADGHGNDD